MTTQTKNTPSEADRKLARTWLRMLIVVLLLTPPAYVFIQAGRAIDLNRNLLEAIRRNDAPTVSFLLTAGADANARDSSQDKRPMLRQILDRLRGIPAPPGHAALLVSLEARPDNSTIWRDPPENIKITQALLDHHADPNVRGEYEFTPLMLAAQQNKEATVQALLKGGAKVNLKDNDGIDALHFAVEMGSAHIVRMLLDAGADVNGRNNDQVTPLMRAIVGRDLETLKLLIASGADVNAKDSDGETPLSMASAEGETALVALLKAAGAR